MRKLSRVDFNITTDCGSVLRRPRLKKPHYFTYEVDADAFTKGHLAAVNHYNLKYEIDPQANTVLTSLRRTMMGRRPQIHLSVWTNDGLVPLNQATLRRGDLHHIQADVIGTRLDHFVMATFMLKGSLANLNVDALAWKSTDPTKGGIELVSTSDVVDMFGAAQQRTYQIALDSLDTEPLKNRSILQFEFQLDDTLGEVYSVQGAVTVIPDVYTRF